MGIQIWFDVDGNFDEEPEGRSEGGENRQAARTLRAQKKQTCNARNGNRQVNLTPTQRRHNKRRSLEADRFRERRHGRRRLLSPRNPRRRSSKQVNRVL